MNTRIWGPPTWRFLHGTCYAVTNTEAIVAVAQELAYVMPCSFCRDSYALFFKELDGEHIESIAKHGNYPTWLYNLHNKVVHKLTSQILEKSNVPPASIETVIMNSYLPYDVLVKRLHIISPYFSEEDVLVMLGVMALGAVEDPTRHRHYTRFMHAVGSLLESSLTYIDLGKRLQTVSRELDTGFQQVFEKLLRIELGSSPNTDEMKQYMDILNLARAHSCVKGVCK